MPRAAIVLLVLIGLSACSAPGRPDDPPADLGNFRLGHDVVVAPDPVQGPASREATAAEWIEALQSAVDARFRPYQGGRLYHFGISVEGYVLARPGVPVIAAPKSLLIFKLTVWDDAAGAKLGARQFIVTEALSEETIVGSGHTRSKEQQMENLSRNAAARIEKWLVQQKAEKGWFEDAVPDDADISADPPASEPKPV